MPNLRIAGTGSYLPPAIISNDFFVGRSLRPYDKHGDPLREDGNVVERTFSDEHIRKVTGIRERRRASGYQSAADLGYFAAVDAMNAAKLDADDLRGIVVATVTQRQNVPSAASQIGARLDARNCFLSIDINAACPGFTSALELVDRYAIGESRGAYLVIGSECLTNIVDPSDVNSTLFGDGAGAVVLVPSKDERGIVSSYSRSVLTQERRDLICNDGKGFLRMPNGPAVMKAAVNEMLESAGIVKERAGWDKVHVYIPHQANKRIIDGMRSRIDDRNAIVYENIETNGNMSAATCPVALDKALNEKTIRQGSRVIITSFGAGTITSAVAVQF